MTDCNPRNHSMIRTPYIKEYPLLPSDMIEPEEVDQASVDVIKVLLESKQGQTFFIEYLSKHLRIEHLQYVDGDFKISLHFNNVLFTSTLITNTNVTSK